MEGSRYSVRAQQLGIEGRAYSDTPVVESFSDTNERRFNRIGGFPIIRSRLSLRLSTPDSSGAMNQLLRPL